MPYLLFSTRLLITVIYLHVSIYLLLYLVGLGSEAKQIPFSRLLSHWKRRLATTLQRENALFILNTSANILYVSNRYTPNQDTYIDEVLNESVHCS